MSKGKKMNKTIKVSGYIRLVDDDNEDAGLMLSSPEEDYILLLDKKSEKLLDMIEEKVKVTGTLSENSEGQHQISVTAYERLNDDDDYDEEDHHYRNDYDDDEDEDED
ncbi:MAG: hypothetical protein ACMUIP_12900 [bacterium]